MKVIILNDNKMIIYLNKFYDKQIETISKYNIEEYFKDMMSDLKEHHEIDLSGYYNIDLYQDEYYGTIIDVEKEELDYFDYFDSQIDMQINVKENTSFLYQIEDILTIPKDLLKKIDIYYFLNEYHMKINQKITNIELGKLLEISELIYGPKVKNILKYGKKINTKAIAQS